jgi:hypothetical protein
MNIPIEAYVIKYLAVFMIVSPWKLRAVGLLANTFFDGLTGDFQYDLP